MQCSPEITLLEMKTYIHAQTYTRMFRAALFIIVSHMKEPSCLSIGKLLNCSTQLE